MCHFIQDEILLFDCSNFWHHTCYGKLVFGERFLRDPWRKEIIILQRGVLYFLLQQAISLENGEEEEKGEEAGKEEDEEEHRAEWPQFNRGMISECQTQEHGSNDDSRIMEV